MDITNEAIEVIGKSESVALEYKAVLPPSRNIAQLISAFANSEGGYIIIGISAAANGKSEVEIIGLSDDFHANAITHKALDLVTPQPIVSYQYISYNGKKLYVIKVSKSDQKVSVEGKIYIRDGAVNKISNPVEVSFKKDGYARIKDVYQLLEISRKDSTGSLNRLIDHYQSVLKIADDLGKILYPISAEESTGNQEGKILMRILFASFVDNFETYLSDLLYEIFLANPLTLKSKQQVTIEEVLNCTDLQEFVKYWAKQKLSKLQKGSVKGFIKDNKQISDLDVIDDVSQNEIERILQIRHLYSHRNGIVDEKFMQYFADQFALNSEHKIAFSDFCDKLCYLTKVASAIDVAAKHNYNLTKA